MYFYLLTNCREGQTHKGTRQIFCIHFICNSFQIVFLPRILLNLKNETNKQKNRYRDLNKMKTSFKIMNNFLNMYTFLSKYVGMSLKYFGNIAKKKDSQSNILCKNESLDYWQEHLAWHEIRKWRAWGKASIFFFWKFSSEMVALYCYFSIAFTLFRTWLAHTNTQKNIIKNSENSFSASLASRKQWEVDILKWFQQS